MTRTPLLIVLAAAAALAGCNKENHTIVAGPNDGDSSNAAANEAVQLPPSIAASKSYRCKGNQLVRIDWMSDGSARVKSSPEDPGTVLPAGSPQLKGEPKAPSITLNGQSCKG